MKFLSKLKVYWREFRTLRAEMNISNGESFRYNSIAGELMRNTHSMEKGLSIENPRLGYGHKVQLEMMNRINTLKQAPESDYYNEVIRMAVDSLKSYIAYHDEREFSDEMIEKIKVFLNDYSSENNVLTGGSILLKKSELNFDVAAIENLFNTRHSIRDFDDTDVDESKLVDALKLAQRAPSACNRQGVRAYVLSKERSRELAKKLEGIGGFAESVNRFIMITGKLSSYRSDETKQYIVSASIYAAYLSLTLHLYGMGGCVVQRSLYLTPQWDSMKKDMNIDDDERLVLLVAVGNLKDEMNVPISHRIEPETMFRFI